jgi:hypothetical protein
MKTSYRCLCLWIVLVALPGAGADNSTVLSTGSCDQPPGFYTNSHYKISKVVVRSPFDYLHRLSSMMEESAAAMGVKAGSEYSSALVTQGQSEIRQKLKAAAAQLQLPVTVNVVVAELQACQANTTPPTLEVAYFAFVSWFPFTFTTTFETQAADHQNPANAARVDSRKVHVFPEGGYNHTMQTYGGLEASADTALGKFALDGIASPSGTIASAAQSTQFEWSHHWLRTGEWITGFRYSDVPANPGRLKSSRLATQFAGNSSPMGSVGAVFRFGGSVAGGYDQSRVPSTALPPGTPTSNPAGEIKAFAGVSFDVGPQSFKASYGVKFGQVQTGTNLDFIKQLVDAAYETRFLPFDSHKPIEMEASFTGGWITNDGGIPSVERFFGGNYDSNFLAGESWQIRSEPFIRSFPQNTLNRLAPNAPVGGQQFLSANLTLAITAWQRPLVPRQITANKEFPGMLNAALLTARKELGSYWRSQDPAVAEALALAPEAASAVQQANTALSAIADSVPDELSDRYDACSDSLVVAQQYVSNLKDTKAKSFDRYSAILGLAMTEDEEGSIVQLSACVFDFRAQIGTANADGIVKRLAAVRTSLRQCLGKVDKDVADRKADQDMVFINRTVHTLIDELNFAAISPVLVADAARIGPQPSNAAGGFRYGVGGGIRFTFLNSMRFTGGYAFNPDPKPWEGRGAAFFALEILSLFR